MRLREVAPPCECVCVKVWVGLCVTMPTYFSPSPFRPIMPPPMIHPFSLFLLKKGSRYAFVTDSGRQLKPTSPLILFPGLKH